MPASPLLDPNNRLLGWSTSDFSLFGGQPTVTLGTARADAAGGSFVTVPSALNAAIVGPASGIIAPPQALSVASPSDDTVPAGPAVSMPGDGVMTTVPPAAVPTPAVPDALGAGSLAPISVAPPLTARSGDDATGSGVSPLTGSILSAPTLDLVQPTPDGGGIAAAVIGSAIVAPLLDRAVDTATTLVAATVTAATGPVEYGNGTVGELLDGLVTAVPVDAVTAIADAASATVDVTVGTTADLASATVEGANDIVSTAATAPGDTVTGLGETVGGITAPLADGAVGGGDPDGGIATLVAMVESADVFDLAAGVGEPAAVTEGGSILDALAADEAPGPLLGVVEDGAGGLLADDHEGGLLGGW